VLGEAATRDDDALDRAVRADLATMAGASARSSDSPCGGCRWPSIAQPVVRDDWVAPSARTPLRGLLRASEVLHSSSLEGAARGGQMAAHAVLSTDSIT
jgi:hypothetical protein